MPTINYKSKAVFLSESNLYAGGSIYNYADGTAELVRPEINYERISEDKAYKVKENETLRHIAFHSYKDIVPRADRWWHIIAIANQIENPLDLSEYVGEYIIIPDIIKWKLRYG